MAGLKGPLLSPQGMSYAVSFALPAQIFRPMPPLGYQKHPGFLSTLEVAEEICTVIPFSSSVLASAVSAWGVAIGLQDGTVAILEPSGNVRILGKCAGEAHSLSIEGNLLAAATKGGAVKMWSLDTFQEVLVFLFPSQELAPRNHGVVAMVPGGISFASSSDSTSLLLRTIEIRTGEKLSGHSSEISYLAAMNDGITLVSAADTELKLWNVHTKQCYATLTGHTGAVTCLALTHDESAVVSGATDSTLRLWSIAAGNLVAIFDGHKGAVLCCAPTPNGTHLISGSADAEIIVWNMVTQKRETSLTGHSSDVRQVYVTPDSQYLLSASTVLIVHSLTASQQLASFSGHTGPISSMALTPDFNFIVTGGLDGTVRVWGRADNGGRTIIEPDPSLQALEPPFSSNPKPRVLPEVNCSVAIVGAATIPI